MQKYERLFLPLFALSYSLLFYHQNAGLNVLLFTLLLTGAYFGAQPGLLRQRTTLGFAIAALFAAVFVLIHASMLAFTVNLLSLLLFAASRNGSSRSLPVTLLDGLYTFTTLTVFLPLDTMDLIKARRSGAGKSSHGVLLYSGVLAVVLIFIGLYRAMNPLFKKATDQIYFNAITAAWLLFTLGGFILMYGFIRQRQVPELHNWDRQLNGKLSPSVGANAPSATWKHALTALIILLNLLMLLITVLDLNYLYLGTGMPDGLTHKQFVHHGVGILMISVLIGVGIMLFSFGAGLSFDPSSRLLKILAGGWLLQNLFMVISTGLRNQLYISDALLTYKRIAVFFWLALTACVLVLTWIKIRNKEQSWFVFRGSMAAAYVLLVCSCAVDWDGCISSYNVSHIRDIAGLDKRYMIDLSPGNIRMLYSMRQHPKFEIDSVYHYEFSKWPNNKSRLDRKLYYALKKDKNSDWRSFSFSGARVMADIQQLNRLGALDSLDLSDCYLVEMGNLRPVTNLRALRLNYSGQIDSNFHRALRHFPKLSSLWLDIPQLKDTLQLQKLRSIKRLFTRNILPRQDSARLAATHFPFELRYY